MFRGIIMQEDVSLNIKIAIEESVKVKELVLRQELYKVLIEAGNLIVESILKGGKVLLCGNGGSAADAQHLTAEFLAFNRAGHIGERPDNKYEHCLQVQADKLYNNYRYVYKRRPNEKAMQKIREMSVKHCQKLRHIDDADMEAWVRKHKDKIKHDPASRQQAIDDIQDDSKWKRRVAQRKAQQN